MPPRRDDPYARDIPTSSYSREPLQRGYDNSRDRAYGGQGDGWRDSAPASEGSLLNLPSRRPDIPSGVDYMDRESQRKPLFPIASASPSSAAEPKSILKKSILKKPKVEEDPLVSKPLTSGKLKHGFCFHIAFTSVGPAFLFTKAFDYCCGFLSDHDQTFTSFSLSFFNLLVKYQ